MGNDENSKFNNDNQTEKENLTNNEQIEVELEEEGEELEEKLVSISESELLSLKEEFQKYKKLSEENFSKLQRAQADFDNYKKVLDKDKQEYCQYAEKTILLKILDLFDDIEITLNAIKKEIRDEKNLEGLEIIDKKIKEFLNKEEVRPIKSVGETFDPFIHEVLLNEQTNEYPEDTILEEIKKGYYLKNKVLRPALVKIAKNKERK